MNHPARARVWQLATILLVVFLAGPSLSAREQIREFLEGLRFRGYHDTALAYIDKLEERADLPPAIADSLGYEKAVTLEMAAAAEDSPETKGELLDRALRHLKTFLQQHADHPLATTARFRMGAVLMTRARLLTDELNSSPSSPESERLAEIARAMFDEAHVVYETLHQWLRDKLLAMPRHLNPVEDAGLIDERDRLRSRYVETQLLKAGIIQRRAETYPKGSKARLEALDDAAAAYHDIFTKYKTRLAGLYARLYEGVCYKQAGDVEAALDVYRELLKIEVTATPVFQLKTNALNEALDCWLADGVKNYDVAVEQGERWLKVAEGVPLDDPISRQIIERLAQTYGQLAEMPSTDAETAARYRNRAAELDRRAAELEQDETAAEVNAPSIGKFQRRGE